jgi:formate hydrogenlyase subunit 3/multisubunit Na+/H+ antiporter MnhD subunit
MYEIALLLSISIPLIGAFILGLLKGRLRSHGAFLMTFISFVLTCVLIMPIREGHIIEVRLSAFSLGWLSITFVGDGTGYIKKAAHQTEYYLMTTLMVGSLMGIAYARNLIMLYIFWEIASIATWRLVGFYRGEKETAIANKTFLMIFAGSSFMLLGFIMIYTNTHTLDMVTLQGFSVSPFILFLISIGIITKAAILPVHNWLPDAHTVAPSPMSALLSGIVVKIGILVFIRIFIWTFHTEWDWILILAVISSIVAASGALLERDMKKIIAYSTVSQMGFLLLGFAVLNEIGFTAGLLYFIVHAIAKAGLFLGAGIVEQKCGERDITKLGGLIKSMPLTAIGFALCALSIIGMPPFGGFFGKIMVISAVVREGHIWISFLVILAAFLTMLYLLRLFASVFLGDLKLSMVNEASKPMVGSALFLGILSLGMGLCINKILGLIQLAVTSVF